jgi:hypothetical protein
LRSCLFTSGPAGILTIPNRSRVCIRLSLFVSGITVPTGRVNFLWTLTGTSLTSCLSARHRRSQTLYEGVPYCDKSASFCRQSCLAYYPRVTKTTTPARNPLPLSFHKWGVCMGPRVRLFLLVALAVCLTGILPDTAFAQQGQINGVVSDSSGGVIPGATVTATESATGFRNRRSLAQTVATASPRSGLPDTPSALSSPASARSVARASCSQQTRA